jgi:signal transduction histidine kinase
VRDGVIHRGGRIVLTVPQAGRELVASGGVRPAPIAARLREQARALAAARLADRDPDSIKIAGHAMERRGVPLLRLILAAAALAIIFVDPAEPDRHVAATYTALSLYTLYSALLFAGSLNDVGLPRRASHWVDVGWHTLLIALSSGTNSLFFFFYFFAIVVASLRFGRAEGLRVTGVAAVLISGVGYAVSSPDTFELNRFLLRPVCLAVLGYLIAWWGGLDLRLRRRLTLLREMTVLRNPRFGVHETLASALEKVRETFNADACLLLVADATDREWWLYEARAGRTTPIVNPTRCPDDKAAVLLAPPYSEAILADRQRWRWLRGGSVYVEDLISSSIARQLSPAASVPIAALDAEAVATVPIRYHHEAVGRLYVTGRSGTFDVSDLDFLAHAMDTTLRITENLRLVDRLAMEAADNERRRIARGIHHTVIQPYIGLQLGLRAVLERVREGDRQVEEPLQRLLGLIDDEVGRLREYVVTLRGMPDPRITFMDGLRRYGRQFQNVTGIEVHVDGPPELAVSERLASELFEMATEALSNVRRHTSAHRAAIGVQRTADAISLTIENDGPAEGRGQFEPRSLREHAHALGGSLQVQRDASATTVAISVPL